MKPEPLTSEDRRTLFYKWSEVKRIIPSGSEHKVLKVIVKNPGISIGQASEIAGMHRQYVKNIFAELEYKEWISRTNGRDNKNRKCTVFTAC